MKWNRLKWIDNGMKKKMKMKCADLIFQKCAETRALASVACTFCQPHLLKCSERLSFLRLLCEIELPLQSRAHFADPIFQKCPERFNVLRFLCETDLLLPVQYTLVHIFPAPIFQKCSEGLNVLRFLCEIKLSLQSRPHFPNPSSKSAPNACKSSSRYCPVRFLSTTFADRGPHPRKQRPYFGERKPLYPKKQRVSRPRVFSSLNSRVPDLLRFPTTWWWRGLHDDVVDMMVRMLPMTIVRNSEVF